MAGEEQARELHAFVLELGRALSLAGAAVGETQERLTTVAAANGAGDARIVVLPTALLVAFGRARWATIEAIPQLGASFRLDQVSALYELVKEAERGAVEPGEGLRRIAAIRAMRARHRAAVALLGYVAMTVGLCLVLGPSWSDVGIAAGFGALVGCLVLLARGRQTLLVLVPVISATAVSALTFEFVRHGVADPGLRTLIAPLVTFLPGGMLTTATVELASGEMVAGASRLVSGSLQLLLLAFGIVAGAELAGLPSASVLRDEHASLLGWWAPWLGVVVFGLAAALYFSAPRGSVRWLLVVLLTAWVGQLVGGALFGAGVSGFFGAIAMTPVALAIARLPGGPPSQVTFLPAFWLLVPGALGLLGVTEVVGDPASAGLQDLVQPLASIVSIALGVLCGVSLYRGAAGAPALLRHGAPPAEAVARLRRAMRRGLAWDRAAASLGALCALPAAAVAAQDPVRGAALAIGVVPAVLLGIPPRRRGRLAIPVVGALAAVALLVGGALAEAPALAVCAIALLGVLGALLARRSRAGTVALTLALPLVGVGLSFSDVGSAASLAGLIFAGSLIACAVALLYPERTASAGAPARPAPAPTVGYGLRLGLAGASAAAVGFLLDLDHVGWACAAALLVMRPAAELQRLRSVGRLLAVLAGMLAAIALIALGVPDGWYAPAVLAAVAAAAGTHAGRWYATAAFTTFLVFVALLQATPQDTAWRFGERLGETALGVALAYAFGLLLPALLRRRGGRRLTQRS